MNELTPIHTINSLTLKRDDLYAPFGRGGVNGGKLRQCMMLIDSVKDDFYEIISYCSIHSPQAPITAASAQAHGKPCTIIYGGTTTEAIKRLPMPRLAMQHGANIKIAARSGRHAVLHAKAKEIATDKTFIVQYGINLTDHADVLYRAVADQAENIPEIENLVITCGSGITATGLMIGLKKYGKSISKIYLVATAPDRRNFIHKTLEKHGADREFEYIDLFGQKGFVYEKPANASWGGVKLHPHYEAKAMLWLMHKSNLKLDRTLFWVTGSMPLEGVA